MKTQIKKAKYQIGDYLSETQLKELNYIEKRMGWDLYENPFDKIRYGIVKEKKGLSRVVLTTEIKV